jgi:hypothetical protein
MLLYSFAPFNNNYNKSRLYFNNFMRVNKYSVYKTSISLFIDFNRYQTSNLFTNLCTLCEVLYFAAFFRSLIISLWRVLPRPMRI